MNINTYGASMYQKNKNETYTNLVCGGVYQGGLGYLVQHITFSPRKIDDI